MLLAHWDNKAVEPAAGLPRRRAIGPARCARPFALINDLGATFGPNKVELAHWQATPIWTDRARCIVSMRQFPYSGGTFSDTAISEAGRQLIARQLTALSAAQIEALFASARFRSSPATGTATRVRGPPLSSIRFGKSATVRRAPIASPSP